MELTAERAEALRIECLLSRKCLVFSGREPIPQLSNDALEYLELCRARDDADKLMGGDLSEELTATRHHVEDFVDRIENAIDSAAAEWDMSNAAAIGALVFVLSSRLRSAEQL